MRTAHVIAHVTVSVTSVKRVPVYSFTLNLNSYVQGQFVKEHVLAPLESLLAMFQDPLHLMHKRRDKLLDYDHMQYALEHAEEPEKIKQLREDCLLAKRNYEALNAQLLEELPHFLELALKLVQHALTVLVHAKYTFHSAVCDILEPLSGGIEQSSDIQRKHAREIGAIAQKLVQLSLVPASLAINFSNATPVKHKHQTNGSPSFPVSPPRNQLIREEEEEEEEGEVGLIAQVHF